MSDFVKKKNSDGNGLKTVYGKKHTGVVNFQTKKIK